MLLLFLFSNIFAYNLRCLKVIPTQKRSTLTLHIFSHWAVCFTCQEVKQKKLKRDIFPQPCSQILCTFDEKDYFKHKHYHPSLCLSTSCSEHVTVVHTHIHKSVGSSKLWCWKLIQTLPHWEQAASFYNLETIIFLFSSFHHERIWQHYRDELKIIIYW